jgi:hypothetical protein
VAGAAVGAAAVGAAGAEASVALFRAAGGGFWLPPQ